ncbi:uncharacterized protein L201_000426 [Kwoniella dendrophila CBS 6074]|uniref:Thc1 RRM domain-containing protein n=1 Tax=Kwoniella dendrophila CBS 6074 TaxID=1295534 RepID=A0AAX4JJE9_9TREE
MSISLPNGTLLAAPSSSSSSTVQLSAAVTRILHLANFSADLKTRDLQNMFKDWETEKGGFRIKWLDDVNALVVFADASIAKRAYLSLLLNPPPQFSGLIKPYDRPDAAQIIQSLAARSLGHRSTGSTMNGSSISTFPFPVNNDPAQPQVHSRAMSVTNPLNKSGSISINPGQSISNTLNGLNGNASASLSLSNGFANANNGHIRGSTAPQRIGGGSTTNGGFHQRSGSASSSWNQRTSGSFGGLSGNQNNPFISGGGVLNFGLGGGTKLPTHNETSLSASRSTSESDGEPNIVILDPSATQGLKTKSSSHSNSFSTTNNVNGNGNGSIGRRNSHNNHQNGARRESVSAEKAMREVEKALAAVETQG